MYYRIIFSIIKAILIIISLIKYKTVYLILLIIIFVEILKSYFALLYLKNNHEFEFAKINKDVIKKMFKYNLQVSSSWIIGKIGQSIDKLILIALVSSSNFAIYSLGCIQVPLLSIFYNSIGEVTLTKIGLLSFDKRNNNEVNRLYKKMVSVNAMLTLPILCFSYFQIENIFLLLFGNIYKGSADIFKITSLITLIQMTGFGYIIRGYGKTRPLLISNLTRLILGMLLSYILIGYLGVTGAAIAYTSVFFINGIILLYYSSKIIDTSISMLLPFKMIFNILLISLLSLMIIYPLKYLNIEVIYFVPLSAICYLSLILTCYLKIKIIKLEDIKRLYNEVYR